MARTDFIVRKVGECLAKIAETEKTIDTRKFMLKN